MPNPFPSPITLSEERSRLRRVVKIARGFGFVGKVDYQHVRTLSGGAQFGLGTKIEDDMLVVSARAFERDADLAEFSLEAIIAHECGH